MTEEKNYRRQRGEIGASISKFHIEADRTSKGMSILISGIVAISELTPEAVCLKSHSGRIDLDGKRMTLSVFENGTVEVVGRIESLRFTYGKN